MKVISSFENKVAYLIHNGTLNLVNYLLEIHVFIFENCLFSFAFSLQKWLSYILLHKQWRNDF